MFGTRKIYAKIMNGRLVIRVGGGYMVIDEFIATYAEVEVNKMEARRAKGLDPVPDFGEKTSGFGGTMRSPKGSPKNRSFGKRNNSNSRSPGDGNTKTFMSTMGNSQMNGTLRSKNISTEKFEKLKAAGAARVIGSP